MEPVQVENGSKEEKRKLFLEHKGQRGVFQKGEDAVEMKQTLIACGPVVPSYQVKRKRRPNFYDGLSEERRSEISPCLFRPVSTDVCSGPQPQVFQPR